LGRLGGYYPGTNYAETLTFGFVSNSTNPAITLGAGNTICATFSISQSISIQYISIAYYTSNTVTATLNVFDVTGSVTAPNVGTISVLSGAPIAINPGLINNVWSVYKSAIIISTSPNDRILQIVINTSTGSRFNLSSILCGLSPVG
jgi:hypothetical protein